MSFLHLAIFIAYLMGYWNGKDHQNLKRLSISKDIIIYAWAFVGLLNFFGLMVADL